MTKASTQLGANDDVQSNKAVPVFIVGSGRSGTTLLRNIINASEQIHIPYESDFIARAFPHYFSKSKFNQTDYKNLVKMFVKTSQKEGWHMPEEYILEYLNTSTPQSFADVNQSIYQAYLQKEGFGDQPWGIKSPVLIANLERIASVFPTAKIIHIVRDVRDVYLSYRNIHDHGNSNEVFGPRTKLQTSLYWIDAVKRVEDFNRSGFKLKTLNAKIFEFRYEDMLTSPDHTLKDLFDFIGIEYDDSIVQQFMQSKSNQRLLPLQAYHQKSVKDNLKSGLDAKNIEKYKQKMSNFDIFVFELLTIPYLKKYNYSIQFNFLATVLGFLIRPLIYFFARFFNDYRYNQRDKKLAKKVNISET